MFKQRFEPFVYKYLLFKSAFSDKCRCGLLHVFQRKSASPFKTSSKKDNTPPPRKKKYSRRIIVMLYAVHCLRILFWGGCYFPRNSRHDNNFTSEHMFIIFWEVQITGMQLVYFAVVWEACRDSGFEIPSTASHSGRTSTGWICFIMEFRG